MDFGMWGIPERLYKSSMSTLSLVIFKKLKRMNGINLNIKNLQNFRIMAEPLYTNLKVSRIIYRLLDTVK